MALDANRLGDAIAATIQTFKPIPGTTVVDVSYLQTMWRAIAADFIEELVTNGEIRLEAGDVQIPGTGLLDSMSGTVTGTAENAATGPLSMRIT